MKHEKKYNGRVKLGKKNVHEESTRMHKANNE